MHQRIGARITKCSRLIIWKTSNPALRATGSFSPRPEYLHGQESKAWLSSGVLMAAVPLTGSENDCSSIAAHQTYRQV
jgi:hypothetical protein